MIRAIKLILFWAAVVFIIMTVFSLIVGQMLPYEFANYKVMQVYYDIIMQGLPIAILLTLFRTIKEDNTKIKNWSFAGLTIIISALSFLLMVSLIFSIGFGTWTTITTLYRHKTENLVIKGQRFDMGALGYGGKRIVAIKPILKYWILPTKVDTSTIDKDKWVFVNKQGDIKF